HRHPDRGLPGPRHPRPQDSRRLRLTLRPRRTTPRTDPANTGRHHTPTNTNRVLLHRHHRTHRPHHTHRRILVHQPPPTGTTTGNHRGPAPRRIPLFHRDQRPPGTDH